MQDKNEKLFSTPLPAINNRIQLLINKYTEGSVKKFSELIGLSSSQKLNRIFNVDQRNNEYPTASIDIITAIANMYSEVSMEWLLTGEGEMLKSELPEQKHIQTVANPNLHPEQYQKDYQINTLQKEIQELNKQIGRLEGKLEGKEEVINILKKELDLLKKDFQTPNVRAARRAVI